MEGLKEEEVIKLREKYGYNEITDSNKKCILKKIIDTIKEPMFLLLLIASLIYFILGNFADGIIMLIFVIFIIGIDIINGVKTDKSLEALKNLTDDKVMVLRDGSKKYISTSLLVPNDIIFLERGLRVPADGKIIYQSSIEIDESLLTGESDTIYKKDKEIVYKGTLVISGSATVIVTKIGINTMYGKIGNSLSTITKNKTKLQLEVDKLVKYCFILAIILFILVTIITFINTSGSIISKLPTSILSGVTLAMALIPEEFPVVLTVFLSLGAYRLSKQKALVKNLSKAETLGAISVLCIDKTGTITDSEMKVNSVIPLNKDKEIVTSALYASNINIPSNLEKALLQYNNKYSIEKYKLVNEIPFNSTYKYMANTYKINDKYICYIKGSYENVIKLCNITNKEKEKIEKELKILYNKSLRVIVTAKYELNKNDKLDDISNYKFKYIGLISFHNPIKKDIDKDIKLCQKAGIKVVMITGDNKDTALSVAKEVGIENYNNIITGDELKKIKSDELDDKVMNTNIFARVLPEDKLKIVTSYQNNGLIVAMTGDGVNDAPALKKADIGIAMGKEGSHVARESADLILTDDNFSTITNSIKEGRRIYDNIKKAMCYIMIIHMPIALSSLIAPLIGITGSNLLFLPIIVVVMELIIDPTCSIIFERLPADNNIMERKPRSINSSIISLNLLFKSIFVGLFIFVVSFTVYLIKLDESILIARTMGLVIIIFSSLLLTILSIKNIKNIINDKIFILINSSIIILTLLIVYLPINNIFKLTSLSLINLIICIILSFISVVPYLIFRGKLYE